MKSLFSFAHPVYDTVPAREWLGLSRLVNDVFDPAREERFVPACDIEETPTQFVVALDVPGIDRKDIHVEAKGRVLRVEGRRTWQKKHEDGKQHSSERSFGHFTREFILPESADAEKIDASYQDGVLTIAIPKSEAAKPRLIEVRSN